MRIGIFGGTFSPVHNGHIAAAHAFMEKMWLDVLYVMPTALPPHKQLHGDAAAALVQGKGALQGGDVVVPPVAA